jgi:hypothetical protein
MNCVVKHLRQFGGFSFRVTACHILTYYLAGGISFALITHKYYTGARALPTLRDPSSAFVQHWILPEQILRGILYALALYPLRGPLLKLGRWGGLVIASLLLLIGPVAGISGMLESVVFSVDPHLDVFLATLPEIIVQTLAFGYLLMWWERKVEVRAAARSQSS